MSYVFAQTVIEGFGPFEKVTIDFSLPGLSCLEGRIDNCEGSNDNGAGKSFLVDAPFWAWFGRCLRPDYSGDEVIHNESPFACVESHILGGPFPLMARRYRKHPIHKDKVFFFVDGKDVTRGTNPQTQLAIEQELGLDFLAATNGVAFGVREDVKSFFSAPDSQRKAVLEKILGLELYGDAEKAAKRKLNDLTLVLTKIEQEQIALQGQLTEAQSVHAAVQVSQSTEDADLELLEQRFKVRHHAGKIGRIERLREDALALYASATKEAEVEERACAAAMAEYDGKRQALLKEAERITDVEIPMVKGEQERLTAIVKRLSGVAGKNCPTCGQDVTKKHADKLCAGIKGQQDEVKVKMVARCTRVEEINAAVEALEIPAGPTGSALLGIREYYESLIDQESIATQEQRWAAEKLKDLEKLKHDRDVHVAGAANRVEELTGRIAECNARFVKARTEMDQTQFWVTAFGNGGIKSFLIEAEIPTINRIATGYAQQILRAGTYIKLCATKQLKTKAVMREELTIEAHIPGLAKSYAGASTGQKRRLNLCLVLAFRDILAARSTKSFSQLFADELFDGVDESGVETIAAFIREMARQYPVLLVTHTERLKSVGDRRYLVHNDGTKADLLAHGAKTATPGGPHKKVRTK